MTRILVAVAGWMAFVSVARAIPGSDEFGYECSGTLESAFINNSITNLFKYRFIAANRGCLWSIRTEPIYPNESYKYAVVSYDGTNNYSFIRFAHTAAGVNTSQGTIHNTSIPVPGGDSEVMPVWLALDCACYLNDEEPGIVVNCWTPFDAVASSKKWKANINRYPQFPFLPERIEFFNDGFSRGMSYNREVVTVPYPEPLDKGFIHRVFAATNFVTVGNTTIPKKFELQFFMPRSDIRTASTGGVDSFDLLKMYHSIRGEIEHIESNKVFFSSDFIPKTDGATYTSDSRLCTDGVVQTIAYLNTNGNGAWVAADSHTLQQLYKQERIRKQLENKSSLETLAAKRMRRYFIVGFFVLSSLVFIYAFVRVQRVKGIQ